MEITLLDLTEEAYEEYRQQVKGNEIITYDQAQRKLTRNVILVKEADKKFTKRYIFSKVYMYGNLHITVKFGKIINIENHKGKPTSWRKNQKRYEQLSKQLGILDYKKKSNIKKKRKPS